MAQSTVKKTINLPEPLARTIEQEAPRQGKSQNALIVEILTEALAKEE